MTFLFGSSKMPEVAAVTPPQVPASLPTIEQETETQKKKLRQGKTQRSTILTGPLGLTGEAPIERKTLLGE